MGMSLTQCWGLVVEDPQQSPGDSGGSTSTLLETESLWRSGEWVAWNWGANSTEAVAVDMTDTGADGSTASVSLGQGTGFKVCMRGASWGSCRWWHRQEEQWMRVPWRQVGQRPPLARQRPDPLEKLWSIGPTHQRDCGAVLASVEFGWRWQWNRETEVGDGETKGENWERATGIVEEGKRAKDWEFCVRWRWLASHFCQSCLMVSLHLLPQLH